MKTDANLIAVGEIQNTHGIKGEVKVRVLTDFPERFKEKAVLLVEKNGQTSPLTIDYVRPHKNLLLIKFSEISDISQAEAFKGQLLKVSRNSLVELEPDTYFIFDLIGMVVVTEEGQLLGKVVDIFQTGSNDVYAVAGQEKEYMIPALKEVVKNIDRDSRTITINPLDGLLDL